jgi:uncharacterized protein (DUF1800 family)
VAGKQGGDSVSGTITAGGLYTAPASLPGQNPVTVTATATDGTTRHSVYVLVAPLGPQITSVSPNPLPSGSYNITVTGTGFLSGALIHVGGVQLPTSVVSSTKLTASGWQGSVSSTTVKVKNPGSLFSNTLTVPVASPAQPISVSPSTATIVLGGTRQFTASGQSNVTWSASAGSISSTGLYTAPAAMPASSTVTITAAGTGNQTGTAKVTLVSPITVSPATVGVNLGATQQFSASGQTNVTWSVSAGSITASGLYTAPATMPASSTVTITATGAGNQKGTATVTLLTPSPTIVVDPATANVTLGTTKQFNAGGQTVTWSASAGSISATGLYTAPTTMPASNSVTITATGTGSQKGTAVVTLVQPPAITVSPATVNVNLGATQQFTASGQTSVTWSASAGSISATGLYMAPAAMQPSNTVTITATGVGNQSGTAIVTLVNATVQLTVSPATAGVSLGATQQFTANTSVTWSATAGSISATGLYTAPAAMPASSTVTVTATSGAQTATAMVTLLASGTPQMSSAAAHRFLQQAGFGPSPGDVAHLQSIGFQAWLQEQFAMPKISNYNALAGTSQGGLPNWFLANAVTNSDQLRQKVAFALSQIDVISITKLIWNPNIIPYEEMLMTDAFTNYRQVLGDVTLNGSMGYYLDMANNAAANPAAGTVANENFAREIMQLFSIGTVMLNPDGTAQTGAGGLPVATYNQTNVTELARVFTGWTFAPVSGSAQFGANVNGSNTNLALPMVNVSAYHDFGSKNLLNGYVSAAGLTAQADLQGALDNIFNHPNVGPFLSKQLIQHLVKSNPSPAYIARVAAAFNNNGQNVRGDMQAVITAILLDPEARANDNGGADQPVDGHLQEPVLYLAGIVRALGGQMNSQEYFSYDLSFLDQDIYNPPSVFNYYMPGYVVPGTTLQGGEFQIFNTFTSLYRANLISSVFSNYSDPVQTYGPGMTVDLTPYVALASNPASLVNAFDNALTGGSLPASLKQIVTAAVQADAPSGSLHQVQTALYLITTSNYYNVWH